MRITYDDVADALYITLIEGSIQCRTVQLSEEVALNLGPDEQLVGIEIIDAKRTLGHGKLPQIVVDNLPIAAA